MRLVTYLRGGARRLGAVMGDSVVDLPDAVGHPAFPTTLEALVVGNRGASLDAATAALERPGAFDECRVRRARLLAPIMLGREGLRLSPGDPVPWAEGVELRCHSAVTCVVGREGRNLTEDEASAAIFGYTLMVRWLVVSPDGDERPLATSVGPALVTPDELDTVSARAMVLRVDGVSRLAVDLGPFPVRFSHAIVESSRNGGIRPGDAFVWPAREHWGKGPLTLAGAGPGSVLEVEVPGIGVLRQRVAAGRA